MRRLFWLGIGLALGVLVYRKAVQTAAKLTPSSVAQSAVDAVSQLAESLRDFSHDVRAATADREATLRSAAELDGGELGRAE